MKKIIEPWNKKERLKFGFIEAILYDVFKIPEEHNLGFGFTRTAGVGIDSYDNIKKIYDYFTSLIKSFVESGVKYHLLDKPSLDIHLIEDGDNCIVKCNIGDNSLYIIDTLYFDGKRFWYSEHLLKRFFCKVICEIVDGFTEEEIETKLRYLVY